MGAFHTRTASLLACLALLACSETSPANPEPLRLDSGTDCDGSACADGGGADATAPDASEGGMDDDDAGSDGGEGPAVDVDRCPPEAVVDDGCVDATHMNQATGDLCDGLDNDCNGVVDDGCSCGP